MSGDLVDTGLCHIASLIAGEFDGSPLSLSRELLLFMGKQLPLVAFVLSISLLWLGVTPYDNVEFQRGP